MKIIFNKKDLVKSLGIVSKTMMGRSTLPILKSILIDASTDIIKLTTNNMDMGIETITKGEIIERGKIAIDCAIFSNIVSKLPDNEITIKADEDNKVNITCENSKFMVQGMNADEFIKLPVIEKNNFIYMSQMTLRDIVNQTAFCALKSDDNSTARIMNGEYFQVKGNKLKVTALDGHRIAIREVELKESFKDVDVIVPVKSLREITKILSGGNDDEVRIYFNSKRNDESDEESYDNILFEFDNTMVVSRLIAGKYYNINQMLSLDYDLEVNVNKKLLQDCVDRSLLMVSEGDKKPIVISVTDGEMEIKINSHIGLMDETIPVTKMGKDINIGFNPKYVNETLRVIEDENIFIYFLNSKSPLFIKDKEEGYIYIILPVAIEND